MKKDPCNCPSCTVARHPNYPIARRVSQAKAPDVSKGCVLVLAQKEEDISAIYVDHADIGNLIEALEYLYPGCPTHSDNPSRMTQLIGGLKTLHQRRL